MHKRTNIIITGLVGVAVVLVFTLRGAPSLAPPPLGYERAPPEETDALATLARVTATLPREFGDPTDCLAATFSVVDNLDPALTAGIFQPGRHYRAHVRLSGPFARGVNPQTVGPAMAIKLYDVDGDFVREANASEKTQDFILGSRAAFPYADATALAMALDNGRSQSTSADQHTLPARWWSMLPYRFGDRLAVKYALRPCMHAPASRCFEFLIQFQNDPDDMPIEDASVAWDEVLSPFEPVALLTLTDPANGPDTDCADLTFSAWQTLAAHAPLGGINRARRLLDGRVPGGATPSTERAAAR